MRDQSGTGHTGIVLHKRFRCFGQEASSRNLCWRPQAMDSAKDRLEQLLRHCDLGHLEDNVPCVEGDFRSDLDEFLAKRGHGPVLDGPRKGKPSKEVAEVVGQGEELKANLVVFEIMARKASPVDSVLPLLDPLLGASLGNCWRIRLKLLWGKGLC